MEDARSRSMDLAALIAQDLMVVLNSTMNAFQTEARATFSSTMSLRRSATQTSYFMVTREWAMRVLGTIALVMGALSGGCAIEAATPACSNPARLEGHRNLKAPGIFIAFKPGVEPIAAARRMIQKYHFNTASQYSWGSVFTTDLDLKWIPSIRCEADVDYVEFNAAITISRTSVAADRIRS
jgi:hypothetical protein